MKKLIFVLLALGLSGCCLKGDKGNSGSNGQVGPVGPVGATGPSGSQGPVGPQGNTGATGSQGVPGTNGSNGSNGLSIVTAHVAATATQCPTGGIVILMAQDALGTGIYDVTDPGQNEVVVCNGATGVTAFSPMSAIEPCGAASSPWKEVLLCLGSGSVLADFSANANGMDTRLAFIQAGSYVDTDASSCSFNVAVAGDGSTTVSWAAGHNQYSTWAAGSQTCQSH